MYVIRCTKLKPFEILKPVYSFEFHVSYGMNAGMILRERIYMQ